MSRAALTEPHPPPPHRPPTTPATRVGRTPFTGKWTGQRSRTGASETGPLPSGGTVLGRRGTSVAQVRQNRKSCRRLQIDTLWLSFSPTAGASPPAVTTREEPPMNRPHATPPLPTARLGPGRAARPRGHARVRRAGHDGQRTPPRRPERHRRQRNAAAPKARGPGDAEDNQGTDRQPDAPRGPHRPGGQVVTRWRCDARAKVTIRDTPAASTQAAKPQGYSGEPGEGASARLRQLGDFGASSNRRRRQHRGHWGEGRFRGVPRQLGVRPGLQQRQRAVRHLDRAQPRHDRPVGQQR